MYASDLTHRKRAQAIYRNLQLQKDFFASGKTIRILGQKGGNDYSYMTQLEEGCINDKCWMISVPISATRGNNPIKIDLSSMVQIDLGAVDSNGHSIIYDAGYGQSTPHIITGIPVIDDGSFNIPMAGQDFFFNEVNYGAANNIFWNTNNAITFGYLGNEHLVSLSATTIPAILLGNYDRLTSKFYYSNYTTPDNTYCITKFVVQFSNYYTDTNNLGAGEYCVRLIKEQKGPMRQWVEVNIITSPVSPGYSNDPTVSYPSGHDSSNRPVDSDGYTIDTTKNSPWDITDGTKFLQIASSSYTRQFPSSGTSILYTSDKLGNNWTFTPNAYLSI